MSDAARPVEEHGAPAGESRAMAGEAAVLPQSLPAQVRTRVVALAADALPLLDADALPGVLRRVAAFTPARRAQLAGNLIAAALETDETFREAVADQVRSAFPELASAVNEGDFLPACSPVEMAALGYLLRPPGWVAAVTAAIERASAEQGAGTPQQDSTEVEKLTAQLAGMRKELSRHKERDRARLDALRADNAELRRQLSAHQSALRLAQRDLDASESTVASLRSMAEGAGAQAGAESRRLRARIRELEAEIGAARRAAKEGREAGSMRARLLLETLLDTASGLRRELALPPVDTLPADTVTAVVPTDAPAARGLQALGVDDPKLLAELLALPRAHLVVDGYNVTKTAWPSAPLETQRTRLLTALAAIVARSGAEVTVVFDGADLQSPPLVTSPRGVRVRFSPPGVIADEVIRQLVAAEPQGRPVVVASSDREVADGVQRSGARAVGAQALVSLIAPS